MESHSRSEITINFQKLLKKNKKSLSLHQTSDTIHAGLME